MTLEDLQRIFNRAFLFTFSKRKLVLVSIILVLCGLLIVFFHGLGAYASQWTVLSLTFIPVFLCVGVLLSTGIWLTRIYHDEIKGKEVKYREILTKSWELIIGASYFAIPVILSYLILWLVLGIFMLLKEIPGIGEFIMAFLVFAPFLLNLGVLLLCLFGVSMLFFVTPVVALKGINRMQLVQQLAQRLKADVFYNLLLGTVAIFPLLICIVLLVFAALLTESMCAGCEGSVYTTVHSLFIMLPFAIMLSPAVVFFFNFAAEAHVLMRNQSA